MDRVVIRRKLRSEAGMDRVGVVDLLARESRAGVVDMFGVVDQLVGVGRLWGESREDHWSNCAVVHKRSWFVLGEGWTWDQDWWQVALVFYVGG